MQQYTHKKGNNIKKTGKKHGAAYLRLEKNILKVTVYCSKISSRCSLSLITALFIKKDRGLTL